MKNFFRSLVLAGALAALALVGSQVPPIRNAVAQVGTQLNEGTVFTGRYYTQGGKPTTVTCTIADGSTNTAGRVTAAGGATSCVITFVANQGSTAAWLGGAPYCMVVDETAVRASMTTAVTTTTLTVSALTTADVFTYM